MPEWFWHWSGYAVALLAFVGVLWALFWDRPRGQRRCCRCWYDMDGAGDVPVACPECGKTHAKPKHLTRTRRRWVSAWALLLVMVVGGYGLWVVPRVQERGAWGVMPTTALILYGPWAMRLSDDHYRHFDWELMRLDPATDVSLAEQDKFHRFARELMDQENRVDMPGDSASAAEELLSRGRYGEIGPLCRIVAYRWWRLAIPEDRGLRERSISRTRHVSRDLITRWVRGRSLPETILAHEATRIVSDYIRFTEIERIGWRRENLIPRPVQGEFVSYGFSSFEAQIMLPYGYVTEFHYQSTEGTWRRQHRTRLGSLSTLRGDADRLMVVVRDEARFVAALDIQYPAFRIAADADEKYLPTREELRAGWAGTLPLSMELLSTEAACASRLHAGGQ